MRKRGYTLVELIIVIAIVLAVSIVSLVYLTNRRNLSQLTLTTSVIAGLLRQAQSQSVAQTSGTGWGVHFSNGTPAFYALYYGSYSPTTTVTYYALPAWVAYSAASIGSGSYADITFNQISGIAAGSSSISLYLIASPQISTTISVASSGAVSY